MLLVKVANTVKRVMNVGDGADEVVAPHGGDGFLGEDVDKIHHVVRTGH